MLKDVLKWTGLIALGILLALILTPIGLVWVVLFMVYRLLTWPFRLVKVWLRRSPAKA